MGRPSFGIDEKWEEEKGGLQRNKRGTKIIVIRGGRGRGLYQESYGSRGGLLPKRGRTAWVFPTRA